MARRWTLGWLTLGLCSRLLQAQPVHELKFVGQATIPTGTTFKDTPVGGLSAITYDPERKVYYALSDDRSEKAPARFYTLTLQTSSPPKVALQAVTPLFSSNRQPFSPGTIDPEGMALSRHKTVYISSEGDVGRGIAPFIAEFSLAGEQQRTLPLPEKFLPVADQKGIRNNLAFESLTLTPDQQSLYTATENALVQDGPPSSTTAGSSVRILQYDLSRGQPTHEYLYLTEALGGSNGLADLLALDNAGNFLSLERSFIFGLGNTIQIFQISLTGATDISGLDRLSASALKRIRPVHKRLVLNLASLGLKPDNLEGLTLGPSGSGQTLVLVSDNNFNPFQTTQFLVFSLRLADR
ncbi:esterase-like activity of phytase family protein [Anthocerotibacter panamensis]|uniref:esterase-like activity of phytase family protein n=1 Tax=Anthocerotibacter panamensis TaxID=2857077 RepID=UPI001C404884|nr:esterase-like activity of phytase family protein [Anthocerotibacter panamensis]